MTRTRLEDLPNELWLELFVYFTWEQLRSTWLQWKLNSRIETLAKAAQIRVAFEISSTSFRTHSQWLNYFENEHPAIAYRVTSLLLNESVLSSEIVSRWLKNGALYFPRLCHCTIYFYLVSRHVQRNIIRLIHQNASTLRRVVLYFDLIEEYEQILNKIIKRRISPHTMQLIFDRGNRNDSFFSEILEYLFGNFWLSSNKSTSLEYFHSRSISITIRLLQRSYCVCSVEEEDHRKQNQYKNNSEEK